ncbi:MAG TPA: flagellar basal body P-ring formation chaperone FlgA [Rhodocyclaceae bacterium]
MKLPHLICLLLIPMAQAWAAQDPAPMRKAIAEFLQAQTRGLPGKASFSIGNIDPNNQLQPCPAMEVSLPPGGRAWGRSNVVVRCQMEGGWTQYVSVHIKVEGEYLVAARTLSQGQVLSEADLHRQHGDLTDLPGNIVIDPAQAIGRTLTTPVAAGRPFRADLLKQTPIIQQGQNVKVQSKGQGFQVSNEGQALNSAAEGQLTRVRLGNGQVVSGVARAGGVVEISF